MVQVLQSYFKIKFQLLNLKTTFLFEYIMDSTEHKVSTKLIKRKPNYHYLALCVLQLVLINCCPRVARNHSHRHILLSTVIIWNYLNICTSTYVLQRDLTKVISVRYQSNSPETDMSRLEIEPGLPLQETSTLAKSYLNSYSESSTM